MTNGETKGEGLQIGLMRTPGRGSGGNLTSDVLLDVARLEFQQGWMDVFFFFFSFSARWWVAVGVDGQPKLQV